MLVRSVRTEIRLKIFHTRSDIKRTVKVSKNSARYRSENNFENNLDY